MSSRKDKETVEEKRLAESVNFRKRYVFLVHYCIFHDVVPFMSFQNYAFYGCCRILEAYRRMTGPLMVEIDANGSKNQVLADTMDAVRNKGFLV